MEDVFFAEPEVPTEIDSDDQAPYLGRKRTASTSLTDTW